MSNIKILLTLFFLLTWIVPAAAIEVSTKPPARLQTNAENDFIDVNKSKKTDVNRLNAVQSIPGSAQKYSPPPSQNSPPPPVRLRVQPVAPRKADTSLVKCKNEKTSSVVIRSGGCGQDEEVIHAYQDQGWAPAQ